MFSPRTFVLSIITSRHVLFHCRNKQKPPTDEGRGLGLARMFCYRVGLVELELTKRNDSLEAGLHLLAHDALLGHLTTHESNLSLQRQIFRAEVVASQEGHTAENSAFSTEDFVVVGIITVIARIQTETRDLVDSAQHRRSRGRIRKLPQEATQQPHSTQRSSR